MAINPISQATKEAILRKSVQGLPLNPTEQGYSSQDVRDAMVKPIIDDSNSLASEIDRIASELQQEISNIPTHIDNETLVNVSNVMKVNTITLPLENSVLPITAGGVFTALSSKQDKLTAGNGIIINQNVISTDMGYEEI